MSDNPTTARNDWQKVIPGLQRVVVPGGWLYRTTASYSGFDANHGSVAVALAFVPDLARSSTEMAARSWARVRQEREP